jgi:hypothetical protein
MRGSPPCAATCWLAASRRGPSSATCDSA